MIYDRQIATAKRLIAKYGAEAVWTKPAAQDGAAKPWRDVREGEPSDFSVPIALFSAKDLGYGSTFALAQMAGTDEIPVHKQMGLMSGGLAFVPDLTDSVVIAGSPVEVVQIDILQPNGIPLLYFLWLS